MATLGRIVSARNGRWLCALGCCTAAAIALWAALLPLPAHSPAAAPPALASGVENAIARREYEASRNEIGLQAPNRAHGLRTYFEPSGVRVHDRTAEGSPQLVQFELAAVGRGAERGVVEPGEVFAAGARVEIRRGELTEWYENSPRGLEQGFDLATRPPGDGELFLELKLSGVGARASEDGLELRSATGRRLRYEKLAAFDANGRSLSARMQLVDKARLRLVVDDSRATYPLTIDPLLSATDDTLLEGNQAAAQLGFTVAPAGDVNGDGFADVIVGANLFDSGEASEGGAFIFLGSATGIEDSTAAGAATQFESNQASAQLGRSVAGAGDVNGDGYADVIIGARFYDSPTANEGAAFVFLGSATGIADGNPGNAAARLEGNQADAQMGSAVASAGDVNGDGYADVIVGSWFYDAPELNEGAAFVFLGGPSGIANGNPATAATQLESNLAGSFFGIAVAGAGDVNGDGKADVIVGARDYDNGQNNEGAAFVFLGAGAGIPDGNPLTASAQLESDQDAAQFGAQVAGAGDVNGDDYADVVVGAVLYDSGETNEGAAFIFHGGAAGVLDGNPTTASVLQSNQANAQLGSGVRGAGDVNGDGYADVIVGAHLYDAPEIDEGAAFVFLGGPSGIGSGNPTTAFKLLDSDQPSANLGFDVAGAGDVNGDGYEDVIAGAELFDDGFVDSGAAFVFLGGNEGIASGTLASAATALQSHQAGAQFGYSIAGVGDLNADGYGDVVVGAPEFDTGVSDAGAAFVFLGGESGLDSGLASSADAQILGDQIDAEFGCAVAGAGDINGDGFADVIIGARNYTHPENVEGVALLYHGGPGGIVSGSPATANGWLESNSPGARFGSSVAGAGDVDGDGFGDVIVGAPWFNGGQQNEGGAFVFRGSAAGISAGSLATAEARFESNVAGSIAGASLFGGAVAGGGDVNGDGYSDVVVGAGQYSAGQSFEGGAFVFLGSASGMEDGSPATAHARIESNLQDGVLGFSVAMVGDVNGDGYGDLAVSARPPSFPFPYGVALLFHGGPDGIGDTTTADTLISGNLGSTVSWVSGAGDVNADGYADVVVGQLAVLTFLGGPTGVDGTAPAAARIDISEVSMATGAGDVNGDGFADLLVGASGHTGGGAVYAFVGNGGEQGRHVLAEQRRAFEDFTVVAPLGLGRGPNSFVARLLRVSPFGRVAIRSELETCPSGTAFGSLECVKTISPTWLQSGSPGGDVLLAPVIGLERDTLYHWRARTLYAPNSVGIGGTSAPPNPPHGPWRRINAQLVEGDIRTTPDADLDGVADSIDNCPLLGNPTQQDTDLDGFGNLCDLCPLIADPTQANFDGDVLGDVCDSDDDNDGLADESEPGYGTNPFDADSDNDGANDGFEANVLHTSPTDPDSDDDAALDGADNCPLLINADQLDADGDARGDLCDNCRHTENFNQADSGGLNSPAPDGVGDVCQNGDWNGDGTSNIVDDVIFRRHLAGSQTVDPRMPPEP